MMKDLARRTINPYAAAVATRSPEERIALLNKSLDQLEGIQNQYAAGCVFIGMELLALKHELGHGEFGKVFKERIERPRFCSRTARRFMRVADVIRQKLATGNASVKLREVLAAVMAPSAMEEQAQAELIKRIGAAVEGRTMQQLMLDFSPQRPALTAGSQDEDPPEERQRKTAAYWRMHYNQALDDLLGKLAQIVTAPRFAGALAPEDLKRHHTHVSALIEHLKPTAKGK